MYEIREDDLESEAVRRLLALHLAGMLAASPPEFSFALDLSGLKAPGMTVWSAWDGEALAGIGALKMLGGGAGEVKSMRTAEAYLRQGVAARLLEHIIGEARRRGLERLSLETGSTSEFEPALALYRKRGFQDGEPFADYQPSAFNLFLQLAL
ncbi:MAG TPA: GNAT family N-acetyltransferase [Caulobacteraceae bacterium]|jgi:putative acetyltransferase